MSLFTTFKVTGCLVACCLMGIGTAFGQAATPEEQLLEVAQITPEQLAEQFGVEWNNVSAYVSRNLKANQTTRSITLSGELTLLKEENILGLSNPAELVEATDETGRDVAKVGEQQAQQRRQMQRHFSFPHRLPNQQPWFGKLQPSHISVTIQNVTGNFPKRLKLVKANLSVLVGKTVPKEIPLEKSDEWSQLSPEISIRFKKCDVFNARVDYQLEGKCDATIQNFHGFIHQEHGLPKSFINKAVLLAENGAENEISGNMVFNPNSSGSAGVTGGSEPVKMRFYIATNVREVAVPFQVEDVEVPTLDSK